MPYLPPLRLTDTAFPEALGQDVLTAIQMIEERWRLTYPLVQYTAIDARATPVASPNELSGESGATKFDPLWGESVPATGTVWAQPHQSGGTGVAPSVYRQPVSLRCRIQRTMREDDLKKLGFDRLRKLIATIPTSLLDAADIAVHAGDRFIWNGEPYEIVQHHPRGWWHNSNVNLYLVMNCESARRGS